MNSFLRSSHYLARQRVRVAALVAAGVLPAAMLSAPAGAQQLEEIVVTATRRVETDVQTTPIAVTSVSADAINRAIPRDLGDILMYAPNVISGKQPGFNAANFAIRGVGQNGIILYFENQVGVIVDDFVIPHIQTANIEMLDIESVEILRGPQGTLFGKNTTGGAINVKTRRPDMDGSSLSLQGQLADYDTREIRGVANFAMSDTLAVRIAALQRSSEGFYENGAQYGPVADFGVNYPLAGATGGGNGDNVGGDDVFSARFKVRWQPTDNLDINFSYEMVRDQGDSPPSVSGTPDGPGYVFNNLGFTRDPGDPLKNAGISNRDDALMGMRTRGHEIDVDGYFVNIDWAFSEDYSLTGFFGHRETDSWLPSTYTGESGPVSLFDANRQDERETTQFELRIASNLDGPFNWVGGMFYQKDETIFSVAQLLGFVDMTLDSAALFGDPLFFNNNPQVLSNGQDAESWALYADGTYELNDRWSIGAGVRFTREEKEWTGRNQVFVQALDGGFDPNFTWRELGEPLAAADFNRFPTGVVRDSEKWNEPTWRLTASFQAAEDIYTYATYSRGFKSGSYNDQTGTGGNPIEAVQARPVAPETADSYEIGMRSEWLDNTVRLNLTGFYVVYDNSQQQLLAEIEADRDGDGVNESTFQETRFFNAAEINVWGLELESTWLVSDNFTISGSVGILDSEFDEFQADTNFDGMIDTDLSDNAVARAPDLTWNVDFLYDHEIAGGTMDYALNVNFVDEAVYAYTAVADTPDGITDDRTLLNASVTYRSASSGWWVRAFGQNLTDERYRVGELPVANLWVMSFYGTPRMLGLQAGIDFDM
ncbi:MAG: iron complex outermembrane receptor protein [Glaciecola sp.]|jgi:iron complex outermembrane receptor protein|uniref:TonB-dependent receptor n=1 Tax=Congregibacter sp. TaxID=2744308 RepID=UPI0039E5699F